jgi:ABC-type lipoprotein release transport system permease subunit
MDQIRLAWKNLWRNRRRTIITLTAIAFSVMLVQSLHNLSYGVYAGMVDSGVKAGSGHVAVYRHGYLDSHEEALHFEDRGLVGAISALDGVEQVLPRLYVPALAQSSRESRGVVLVGVDPQREIQINPFLKSLPESDMIRDAESRDAVVGVRLLEELQIRPGQKFVVTAQHQDGTLHSELLRVKGVVRSGMKDIDRTLILIGRERAGLLIGSPGSVHELAVILSNPDDQGTTFRQVARLLTNHS